MAKIGNTDISKIYLGSTEVTKAYLGSDEVYSSSLPASEWVYIGTTGSENETKDRGKGIRCPSTNDNLSYLTNEIDPSTRLVGHVVKVTSSYGRGRGGGTPCTTHYFIAQ